MLARKSVEDIVRSGDGGQQLQKTLGALSITAIGIGAVIGAGIFVLTGTAAARYAGPAASPAPLWPCATPNWPP